MRGDKRRWERGGWRKERIKAEQVVEGESLTKGKKKLVAKRKKGFKEEVEVKGGGVEKRTRSGEAEVVGEGMEEEEG